MGSTKDKSKEVKELLRIYRIDCFSLTLSLDDTGVEEEIKRRLQNIENRILELVSE